MLMATATDEQLPSSCEGPPKTPAQKKYMSQNQESNQSKISATDPDRFIRTDHLTEEIGGRTARGGAVTILSNGLKFCVSIAATALLARLLDPKDYGLIAMVGVVTAFASLFKDMGLSLATVQKSEINDQQVSNLFWVNVILSVIITVIIVTLAPGVAWFYGEPRLTAITVVTAIGFILSGLTVQHEALLKRQMRFIALSTIAFVSMAMGYVVGIGLAWSGVGYWALVGSQLALLGTNVVAVWLVCGWRPKLPRRDSGVRSMLAFGRNVTGYSTVNYFAGNMDYLLIGKFLGPQQLGFYLKASQLVGLPTDQISEPIASVTIPALSRLNDSPERYRQAYLRIMQKIMMLTMPCIAFMIASADWLVHLVLGPKWSFTSRIFIFLAIACLVQPINTAGWLLVSQARTKHMFQWSLISAPITILLVLIGLWWGAIGVAVSVCIGKVVLLFPLMFWFVGRTGPVRTRDFYQLLGPFTCASIAALLACLGFRALVSLENPLIGSAICFAITCITTLLVLFLLPAGRAALNDVKRTVQLLLAIRPEPMVRAQD
jgi:PST family polysaccharide transporter